ADRSRTRETHKTGGRGGPMSDAVRFALAKRVGALCRGVAVTVFGLALGIGLAQAETAVTIQPPNLSGSVAGSLAGTASVGSSGASAYSIPIAVPPGTAGIAPSISLNYSSQAGMGYLGQGWSIGGLSTITRCGRTIAQDGIRAPVGLTSADQFCLDGQRLVMVPGSGTHGATAEYRTEIDSFSKVTSVGTDPTKGPDTWTVYTKSGAVLTFGTTSDSVIEAQGTNKVLTWALSRSRDRLGNFYDVAYAKAYQSGTTPASTFQEFYPTSMRYTGNTQSNLPPYNAV